MRTSIITQPAAEPITLAEAKTHLRETGTDRDALIGGLIVSVRQACEEKLGRSLMTQTLRLTLDYFPASEAIELQRPPVQLVTSVQYINENGGLQTLSPVSYSLDNASDAMGVYLLPAYNTDWPNTRDQANAVLITYVAGYADAASVPAAIKTWMLLHIAHLYDTGAAATDAKLTPLPFLDGLLDRYRLVII